MMADRPWRSESRKFSEFNIVPQRMSPFPLVDQDPRPVHSRLSL